MELKAEFSLFFPWFRLHYVAILQGEELLDVGLSPLGSDVAIVSLITQSWLSDAINDVILTPIAKAFLIGWTASELALFLGMEAGPVGFAVGFGLSLIAKMALLGLAWNSANGLKGSFVGAVFSLAYGFIASLKAVVDLGIAGISDFLELSNADIYKIIFKFICVPINIDFFVRIISRVVALGGWQL